MAKVQVYVSSNVINRINAIVQQRKLDGARVQDASLSSVSSMLLEYGLKAYETQWEEQSPLFNQHDFNRTMLEMIVKTQFATNKILGISSQCPHIAENPNFEWKNMVDNILEETSRIVNFYFEGV
ncbi:TPA: relaxosome protein TraM [Klebsiella aerogenes]|nr:relaxosome protein TraM [Klebsiella aerogenes]